MSGFFIFMILHKPENCNTHTSCVYKITFDNRYFYIGSTHNLQQRLYQHRWVLKNKKGRNYTPFKKVEHCQNAQLEIIEVVQSKNIVILKKAEDIYIKKYWGDPLLLNMSYNAAGNTCGNLTERVSSIKVEQLDLNGNHVASFNSIRMAAKANDLSVRGIRAVLYGKRPNCKKKVFKTVPLCK